MAPLSVGIVRSAAPNVNPEPTKRKIYILSRPTGSADL